MANRLHSHAHGAIAWWTDDAGVTHICESAAPFSNELLIWTLCDREVETGASFAPAGRGEISCRKCAAAEGELKRRAQDDLHPMPLR